MPHIFLLFCTQLKQESAKIRHPFLFQFGCDEIKPIYNIIVSISHFSVRMYKKYLTHLSGDQSGVLVDVISNIVVSVSLYKFIRIIS